MTHEQLAARLDHLLALMGVGVGIGLLVLTVTLVNLVTRRRDHAETARQMAARRLKDEELWGLLKIVKGWAESARTHTKDAVHAIQGAAGAAPAIERHVIDEVRKVPEATVGATADRAARQDEKLDTIHTLVNSSYSAQLKINATAMRRIADLTGHADDRKAAEQAERLYREHEAEQQKLAAAKAGPGCNVAAVLVGLLLVAWTAGRADAGATLRHDNEVRAVEWWAGRPAGSR
jgi:hypothetical protein